jgi:glycosyltransferase involved in cell wall biosynthesis
MGRGKVIPTSSPRILMVIRLFDPWLGGTQKQAHRLARELLEKGVDVQLVTGWWFRGTRQREVIDGIPVFRNHTLWEGFGIRGARTFGGYVYILTLLWHLWRRRRTYDVIHVHGLSYHTFATALASRWLDKPMVTKLANSGAASDILKMREGQHLALSRFMLPTALRSGRFVALNRAVERELLDAGVPGERITTIPNGIDPQVAPEGFDGRLHRPPRVLFVGRLHHQKGVDVLLRAARLLRERDPHLAVSYQVVGDGPLRDELSALTRELGLTKEVEFWGERGDVPSFLRDTDVFVLPSRAEGISNALLEAMSLGLPVIVSAVPGNEDVVEHEREGLLVQVDDPGSLTTAIRRVLGDADLRERLGHHARRAVESRYSIVRVADRYQALYRELVGGETLGHETGPMPMAPKTPEVPGVR